jgi:hypothetical protein
LRRRKFTKTQRRALAVLLLAQKKYLSAKTPDDRRRAEIDMRDAAQAANRADAMRVYEEGA